jgi:hypothetical protein
MPLAGTTGGSASVAPCDNENPVRSADEVRSWLKFTGKLVKPDAK